MSYTLTQYQQELQQKIYQLAQEKIKPRAAEIDTQATYPFDIKELLAQHGYVGANLPQEYGGLGLDLLSYCLVIEEIARVCASSSQIITVQELGSLPILIGGDYLLKEKYLPSVASGRKIAAFALTEANAGSDVNSLETTAVRKGDYYILNGTKRFISNGGVADIYSVFAKTEQGITAFVVEKETEGFAVERYFNKMGIRGCPTAELSFTNCHVPAANRIGAEGEGFLIAMKTLDKTRPGIGAQALGIAQGAFDIAVEYAQSREQFGRSIYSFQGIQFLLADLATSIEAARSLVYRSASEVENLKSTPKENNIVRLAAMAKLFASDTAMKVTTDAVQILGGNGYVQDYPVERMMRDAKITQIYEGTNQIQRLVISRTF